MEIATAIVEIFSKMESLFSALVENKKNVFGRLCDDLYKIKDTGNAYFL